MAREFAQLGAAGAAPPPRPAAIAVWPENVRPLRAFLACATQWRVVAVGGGMGPARLLRTGLDYSGVRAALRMARIRVTPRLFEDLRAMEQAALEVWAHE